MQWVKWLQLCCPKSFRRSNPLVRPLLAYLRISHISLSSHHVQIFNLGQIPRTAAPLLKQAYKPRTEDQVADLSPGGPMKASIAVRAALANVIVHIIGRVHGLERDSMVVCGL